MRVLSQTPTLVPAVLAGLAVLTLGCATGRRPVTTASAVAAAPVPTAWEATGGGSTVETLPTETWWTSFGDPRLDELIGLALAENQDLAAAGARLDAASAQARIVGADLAPQIGVGLNGSRRRQNFIGLPIPGREGSVLSSTSTNIGVSLNVSWEADLWGRLHAAEAAGMARVAASGADLEAARQSLAAQTAKAWFAVLEAERQLELAAETLDNRSRSAEQIRRRFERGLRNALDLRFALANEAAAAAALAGRRRQADGARRQLELLLGRYPSAEDQAARAARLPELPPPPPAGLPAELLLRRPDLLAAESRLAAAGFDVERARAALYPSLALTGSAGRLSSELEDLVKSDFSIWSLAANLLQPVFQGGRLRAGVDLAGAHQREAAHGYAAQILRAFAEVELALAAATHLDVTFAALAEAATQAGAAETLAEERYFAGLADYLSVLEAQRQAFVARSQLLEVERRRLENRVDLHLALGGSTTAGETVAETAASSAPPRPTPSEASSKR